ncbi:SDR family NAD(P)-dependent oxidoreductase [Pyxidicoccus xibeiensis]|uniref:SDR family NAD(P)-dependent oxidoreductase n=1 Tax=Pyxidicoccus xibeiensis TaxID=2906759 RepID=UPI0020A7D2AF|nr:SDR family oxidoreductase [Pyxidicoccus xibeiensis]MCP3136593.1 SDR family oxidoreductase [Pyxidicoccus xibeiensis]
MKDFDFAGKTVVVTGGSMGIGETFARELSQRGAKLVLVARGRDRLHWLADALGGAHVIAEDLTKPGAAKRVFDAVVAKGLEVDVLINNAGFASYGPFTEVPLGTQREQVDLNVGALVELTHLFLPMLERRQGGVIQVASTAAFQPVPYMAVYAATKAFVLSFSEALWEEYRSRGVRVLALCPGATDTPFFARAGEAAALGAKAKPEDVVRLGLRAFRDNRASVVQGTGNTFTTLLARFFTREFVAKLSGRLMRPKKPLALQAS